MLLKDIKDDIALYKKILIRRAKKGGIKENFGQREVSELNDKYRDHQYKADGIWDAIREFDNWCMTLDIKALEELKNKNR
jgi:hypothetical protein